MKRTCLEVLEGEPTGKRVKHFSLEDETTQEEMEITRNIRIMQELLVREKASTEVPAPAPQRKTKSLEKTRLFQPTVVLQNWISSPKVPTTSSKQRYLSVDCEFVQCGNRHALARISIVDEQCRTVLDEYVRPTERITNYISFVSGITYEHIKHASTWLQLRPRVEGLLKGSTVVGHTTHSDLKVMQMEGWQGFRSVIDISKCKVYRDELNRIQGLKKLASKHLSCPIQTGSHCSVQDAAATMRLFQLNKSAILSDQQCL